MRRFPLREYPEVSSPMHKRSTQKTLPGLERLEEKQLQSAGSSTQSRPRGESASRVLASLPAEMSGPAGVAAGAAVAVSGQAVDSPNPQAKKPTTGFLMYRITNPDRFNNTLIPPFGQVLVQPNQPVPGQVYNILSVVARNGTSQTFTASSGFFVRFPTSNYTVPILTGNEEWKPGERIVFYVLTKKYYPLPSEQNSGFIFDLAGARSVAIPGPSAIALRIRYEPATFSRTLDSIVAFGPGNQGGVGAKFGLPNTAINEFLVAQTNRIDFGGYF
jgi:hypothetical protein